MSTRSAWVAAALAVVPGAFAALVGAPFQVVAGLLVAGLVLVLSRVGRRLYGSRTDARAPRPFESVAAADRPAPLRGPRDLDRLETLVAARGRTAAGVHFWVRPLVSDIAEFRLRGRGGLDPQARSSGAGGPGPARPVVPEPLWGLIRSDRPEPADRTGPGLSLTEMGLVVDQLEQL